MKHEQVSPSVEVIKKRACRTRFTIYQRAELEAAFSASPYLTPHQRMALAARLRVKPVAVQVINMTALKFLDIIHSEPATHREIFVLRKDSDFR